MSVDADPPLTIEMRVARTREGFEIRYWSSRAFSTLSFDPEESLSPHARIEAQAEILLDGGVLTAASPRREFILTVTPDQRGESGLYPLMLQIADAGYALHLPSILPDPARFQTELTFEPGPGERVLPERAGASAEARNGYIFIGSSDVVQERARLHLIARPGAASAQVASDVDRLLEFFTRRLARPPSAAPVVLMLDDGEVTPGEATANGVIIVSGNDSTRVRRVLAHELFHLWNAPSFAPAEDGQNDLWLLEGAAEYGALLAVSELWPGTVSMAQELTRMAGPCRTTLGGGGLLALRDQRTLSTRYSCGVLAHWSMDLDVRHASGDARTIYDVWRALLAADRYDVAALRSALEESGYDGAGVNALLDGGGWSSFRAAANRYGAVIAPADAEEGDYRRAALLTVVREGWGRGGYEERGTRIFLDTGGETLLNGAELLSVDGRSVASSWATIYQHISLACLASSAIALELVTASGRRVIRIECRRAATPVGERDVVARAFGPGL